MSGERYWHKPFSSLLSPSNSDHWREWHYTLIGTLHWKERRHRFQWKWRCVACHCAPLQLVHVGVLSWAFSHLWLLFTLGTSWTPNPLLSLSYICSLTGGQFLIICILIPASTNERRDRCCRDRAGGLMPEKQRGKSGNSSLWHIYDILTLWCYF